MRALLEALAVVAVAHEQQQRVDTALADAGEHRQEIVGPLDRGHPAEPPDDELPLLDAVAAPDLGRVAVEADARLELDPEPDDGELLARRDVERHELVPHLGADRDQPVRGMREDRLDGAEEERPAGAEVAAKHVPMERVDDHRATRSGEQRSGAADRARLRRMRVDDIRAHLADQAREPDRRERVADG